LVLTYGRRRPPGSGRKNDAALTIQKRYLALEKFCGFKLDFLWTARGWPPAPEIFWGARLGPLLFGINLWSAAAPGIRSKKRRNGKKRNGKKLPIFAEAAGIRNSSSLSASLVRIEVFF